MIHGTFLRIFFKMVQRPDLHLSVLHSQDLRDLHGLSAVIPEPGQMDDNIHSRCDLVPDGLNRKLCRPLQHHGLQTGNRILTGIRMSCGQRAVMSGIHCLQHIQRLLATDLSDDDPFRPHAE